MALLYDVGDLASRRYHDETGFLTAVLQRLILHLEGEWSAAAYVYNEFNDEMSRVATLGPTASSLAETFSIEAGSSSALDTATFCVALAGKADTPGGFLVLRNERAMTTAEKSETEVRADRGRPSRGLGAPEHPAGDRRAAAGAARAADARLTLLTGPAPPLGVAPALHIYTVFVLTSQ